MKLPEKLLEHRFNVEKTINRMTGGNVSVFQLMMSSLACGCVGLTFFPIGLKREDLEVFGQKLIPQLKEVSKDFGGFSEAIFIQTRSDDSEIAKLKLQSLCKDCKSDYDGAEGKPWPGVYVLQYDKTEEMPSNDLFEKRMEIEEKLRKMSGKIVHIGELGVFVLSCGCTGFVASLTGLNSEDLEGKDISFFKEMSSDRGVDPKFTYALLSYGTNYVSSITSKNTCSACKVKYEEGAILPDLVL